MRVLLVDDDDDLVEMVGFALRRAGFEVVAAHDSAAARRSVSASNPDLIVLDVNLGGTSGFDFLNDLRRSSDVPVIMLTGRAAEEDRVLGLESGADDYLAKPFSHRELVARVRAVLRRQRHDWSAPVKPASTLTVGGIVLNVNEHSAKRDNARVDLTVTEFRLLHFLMVNAGAVVPTRTILKHVWGYDDPAGTEVVRVTVHRLRRKLEDDATSPRVLHTIPGVGVMLKPDDE